MGNAMGLMDRFSTLLGRGKNKTPDPLEHYLALAKKDPGDAKVHLKLAEIYQKNGEKAKAISEYLQAADIFAKNNFYAQAMAIYKQVPRQDPTVDHVYLKIADIYRKMGFLGDAFATYRILVQHYDRLGMKQKALEVMAQMAELDPRKDNLKEKMKDWEEGLLRPVKEKGPSASGQELYPELGTKKKPKVLFDLGAKLEEMGSVSIDRFHEVETLDKVFGFEEIFRELKETSGPSNVDPNFNYNMGVACREMGFFEDAVEQFRIAMDSGQNPFDAAIMLGLLYKEQGRMEEAKEVFEKALKMKGIPKEKILEVKYELGLLYKETGKAEEALRLLREISTSEQKWKKGKDEIQKLEKNIQDLAARLKK